MLLMKKRTSQCLPNPRMQFDAYVTTCYPKFLQLGRFMKYLPLQYRSLLIKTCQAQHIFTSSSSSPLYKLLDAIPPITFLDRHHHFASIRLWEVFTYLEIDIQDPLLSAIALDILRSYPPTKIDSTLFIHKGWSTELLLVDKVGIPEVNFLPLFFQTQDQDIHPSLPSNPTSNYRIRRTFEIYRDELCRHRRRFFPRATHKNMSRDTRRQYTDITGISLEGVPIFGQDDWQRYYHKTGNKVPGVVEMRQKWYPSGAKPRTYFAMGGTCYAASRFLQDFFTELTDIFPPTNHSSRLQPSRLVLSADEVYGDHYLIYDLSSFTSNMIEQRNFVSCLALFMGGVIVEVVDECVGLMEMDLGELLIEYYEICVERPRLSLERTPLELGRASEDDVSHLRASMLGIFGNLMTCTLAHYCILAGTIDSYNHINVAGDDAQVRVTEENLADVYRAISLVGDCASDKTMMSDDEGCVCLKRPLQEARPHLLLAHNLVPPNLSTSICYLLGRVSDPRYQMPGLDEMRLSDRISTVGKDLMRFLRSCYLWGRFDQSVIDVYKGFGRLAHSITGQHMRSGGFEVEGIRVVWPVDPGSYSFQDVDPFYIYSIYNARSRDFKRRETVGSDVNSLRYAGDVVSSNSNPRLSLLERLGYLEREDEFIHVNEQDCVVLLYQLLLTPKLQPPEVYTYTCLIDIPDCFLF
jgi:hypothetical protein